MVQIEEQGVNIEIEIHDRAGVVIARSDSPVERSALQYVYVPVTAEESTLVVRATEPAGLEGKVRVTFMAVDWPAASEKSTNCAGAVQLWSEADMASP